MSYHVTILRTVGGKENPISEAEVTGKLSSIREVEIEKNKEGLLIIYVGKHGKNSPILIWQEGVIWTANPNEETLSFMLDIAEKFNARVRGDDLETYLSLGKTFFHPDDLGEHEKLENNIDHVIKRTKRKQRIANFITYGFFIVLALVAGYCSKS
ncbi:hypothetical protein ACFL2V_01105 [Pseudomonadota bacterium]